MTLPQENSSPMELGVQPLDAILEELDLRNHDLVAASTEQLTHKMVAKARKGRRLKRGIQLKVLRALNEAADREEPFELEDLFTYLGKL